LGQVGGGAKSNEITAIPKLLEMRELSGAMVTIDAMGCQTGIARQIVEAGADYCLAVKDDQPALKQGIFDFFEKHLDGDFAGIRMRYHITEEKGHGREETRYYMICPVPEDLPDRARWTGLKANGVAISDTQRDEKKVGENRYYILSTFISARRFGDAVHSHRSIKNRLHWQLDVTFQEDQCRIRQGHADANFSILRRAALSLLKNETTLKVGGKNKRLTAGWDTSYLGKVLLSA
jgi:predicted transposase YbfD/YdcC